MYLVLLKVSGFLILQIMGLTLKAEILIYGPELYGDPQQTSKIGNIITNFLSIVIRNQISLFC